MTEGDTFDFKLRIPHTSKPAINPTESGFEDSANILSSYECTRLIMHLMNQKGVFNEGRTKTPEDEDYPSSTPPFSLSFYKSA